MTAYYNEIDPYAAEWLRNLIKERLIPDGEVDTRSIVDVRPADLVGFHQCHFFAGIGGWPLAARIAGWPDDEPIWTGSPPCQPFSEVGQRRGFDDARDLWPAFVRLVLAHRPAILFAEQVPEAISLGWLDRAAADLEGSGYRVGSAVLSACVVQARHERERLWLVANTDRFALVRPAKPRQKPHSWTPEPSMDRVAHGVPARPQRLRAYGNALVPDLAAEVIAAFMEAV